MRAHHSDISVALLPLFVQRIRLGFLSEGAFFGEAAVLADESGRELRRRTLTAVTDSELCYLNRDDVTMLRQEYPELDARLKRFVNVGNIRLSKKNGCVKLFPELATTGMSTNHAEREREQRRIVGEYATTYHDMMQVKKSIQEDGVAIDSKSMSLQQLGVDKAKKVPTMHSPRSSPGPLVPTTTLRDLPQLPNTQSMSTGQLGALEDKLDALQRTFGRELEALHSKNDALQGTLQTIAEKLNVLPATTRSSAQ